MAHKKFKLQRVRRNTQIAIYAPPPLYNRVVREAERRHIGLGATCLQIVWEYFEKKEQDAAAASPPAQLAASS